MKHTRLLMNCWQMLESALNEGTVANDWLGRLGETKSIPNKDRVLHFPTRLFFENRAGLAAKFGFLENNIIPRYLGTGQAFLAAGVRLLGSAVGTKLLRTEDPDDDPDTMDRLRHRHEAIARVLSGQMASDEVRDALRRLDGLACKLATSLYLQYSLRVFDRDVESRPEAVLALYQPDQHSLWATHQNGQLPLAPLARELAIALCPEEDPGLFAAGLKEVLVAKTTAEAATVLDELGFSQLDTTVVEAPPSQEAAYHLGTEAPIDNDELPPQHVRDESQPEVTPRDGTATLAESESSVTGDAPPHRGREFVSYVAVSPDDEEGSEPDSLTHQERMSLEDKAIELIIKQEPELKRMPTNNPGFDLTESASTGSPLSGSRSRL